MRYRAIFYICIALTFWFIPCPTHFEFHPVQYTERSSCIWIMRHVSDVYKKVGLFPVKVSTWGLFGTIDFYFVNGCQSKSQERYFVILVSSRTNRRTNWTFNNGMNWTKIWAFFLPQNGWFRVQIESIRLSENENNPKWRSKRLSGIPISDLPENDDRQLVIDFADWSLETLNLIHQECSSFLGVQSVQNNHYLSIYLLVSYYFSIDLAVYLFIRLAICWYIFCLSMP